MTDTSVELSEETYGLLAKRAEDKGFDTTEEYINYVLDQVAEKAKKERWRKMKTKVSLRKMRKRSKTVERPGISRLVFFSIISFINDNA